MPRKASKALTPPEAIQGARDDPVDFLALMLERRVADLQEELILHAADHES